MKRRRGTKSTNFFLQKKATKSISFLQQSAFPCCIYFAHQFQDQPEVFQFKERRKLTLLIQSYTLKSQNLSTLSHLVGTKAKAWQIQVNKIIWKITNQIWHDHTFIKRSKAIKRDRRRARSLGKTRSMVGKQYRVSLHKIGTFLKPTANYGIYIPQMADGGYIGEEQKRCLFKNLLHKRQQQKA